MIRRTPIRPKASRSPTRLEIWFEEFCTTTEHYLVFNDNDDAEPEDLDVDVSGSELVFILTNTDVAAADRGAAQQWRPRCG